MGDWQQQSGKVPFDVNPLGGHHESEGWVASGQKTTREGAQPHPSTDNRIATLLSMALPTRTRPGFSHRSSLPSGSLHQPLSLLQQRADRRSKKNHNSTADKAEPHYRKLICNIYRYMCVCGCVCVCVCVWLPWWLSGEESTSNAGDTGSIPGSGRSSGEGNGTHFSIFVWEIPWTEEPGRL